MLPIYLQSRLFNNSSINYWFTSWIEKYAKNYRDAAFLSCFSVFFLNRRMMRIVWGAELSKQNISSINKKHTIAFSDPFCAQHDTRLFWVHTCAIHTLISTADWSHQELVRFLVQVCRARWLDALSRQMSQLCIKCKVFMKPRHCSLWARPDHVAIAISHINHIIFVITSLKR